MHQNFKTDIIYYNTATDFELEFNLCGCCRMRLFNDKCSDKKTLFTSLSRAFARSRIIILTAPLFDGTNIIKSISTAIGKNVETVDTNAFNINSDEPIEITKGAIPLVTADGIFGGCIIESGPQTLIILTDNKSIRKNIMVSLIHPYIEEISIGGKPQSTPQPIDTEEIITEQDEEAVVEETQEPELEPEEMILTFEEDDSATEENSENDPDYYEEEGLLTEVEDDSEPEEDDQEYSEGDALITDGSEPDTIDQDDEPEYYENDYYVDDIPEEKNSAFNIVLIVICGILLLAIVVLCYCIFFVPAQNETTPAIYLKEIFDTMFK